MSLELFFDICNVVERIWCTFDDNNFCCGWSLLKYVTTITAQKGDIIDNVHYSNDYKFNSNNEDQMKPHIANPNHAYDVKNTNKKDANYDNIFHSTDNDD